LNTLRSGDVLAQTRSKHLRDGYVGRLSGREGMTERQHAGLTGNGLFEERGVGKEHGDIACHGGCVAGFRRIAFSATLALNSGVWFFRFFTPDYDLLHAIHLNN